MHQSKRDGTCWTSLELQLFWWSLHRAEIIMGALQAPRAHIRSAPTVSFVQFRICRGGAIRALIAIMLGQFRRYAGRVRGRLRSASAISLSSVPALLDCFRQQGVAIRSVSATRGAASHYAVVHRLSGTGRSARTLVPLTDQAVALDALAQKAHVLCADSGGVDLLVLPATGLAKMLMHVRGDFPFRAV